MHYRLTVHLCCVCVCFSLVLVHAVIGMSYDGVKRIPWDTAYVAGVWIVPIFLGRALVSYLCHERMTSVVHFTCLCFCTLLIQPYT